MSDREVVTLTVVDTRVEADVIVSMLKAYGIYAFSPEFHGRRDGVPINVINTDYFVAHGMLDRRRDRGQAPSDIRIKGQRTAIRLFVAGVVGVGVVSAALAMNGYRFMYLYEVVPFMVVGALGGALAFGAMTAVIAYLKDQSDWR